jgi:hypothetical protein
MAVVATVVVATVVVAMVVVVVTMVVTCHRHRPPPASGAGIAWQHRRHALLQ